jgi:hypothetical protein
MTEYIKGQKVKGPVNGEILELTIVDALNTMLFCLTEDGRECFVFKAEARQISVDTES